MRRVLVVTWALGTASGVLLGLFGVQLVSSRFSNSRVSPLSHPEVIRALQAARSVPAAPAEEEVALPATPAPEAAVPPSSPTPDAAPARPSAGAASSPAASPASSLPRPGATSGTLADPAAAVAATPPTTAAVPPPAPEPPPTSTSATTATTAKPKSKSKSSTTTTTEKKSTTTTGGHQSTKSTTISCTGGDVIVRFSDGKVELKAARPNAGYRVYVPEQRNPGEVLVYFYNDKTAYQVRAFYNYGKPDSKITKYQWSDRKDDR